MYNNIGLVEYAKEWLKYETKYGWGCWGQLIGETIINQKANQYPSHYPAARQAELKRLIGKAWLIDCVGLIKGYYWGCIPGGRKVNYNSSTDVSADDMYYRAGVKGIISKMPDVPGLCVQLPGHIGIYIGNGKVIESTKGVFGDGVVVTNLNDRKWVHWLQCPYISYKEGDIMSKPTGDNPSDWARKSTEWAKEKGIIVGDGQGNYDWQKPLTRESMAVILHEFALTFGLEK